MIHLILLVSMLIAFFQIGRLARQAYSYRKNKQLVRYYVEQAKMKNRLENITNRGEWKEW